MRNANIVTTGGRPHDIRCPQSGRTDVSDCCKPMVAFTAAMEERERCIKIAESLYSTHFAHSQLRQGAEEVAARIRLSKPPEVANG